MSSRVPALLAILERGQDSALLRFSLGLEYLNENDFSNAAQHLRVAVRLDENYSAAWKLLGKALDAGADHAGAKQAFQTGIVAADKSGDRQSAKEMKVFLRRLEKTAADE